VEHRKRQDVPLVRVLDLGEEIKVMVREAPAHRPSEPYPAEKARGGRIILKTPLQRGIFIAGLVGAVILVLVLALVR
jgi:hypothetical protein